MAGNRVKRILYLLLLIGGIILSVERTEAAEKDPVEEMKNSIIEVQAGLTLSNGKFYPVKNASGCLISNDADGVFVVTANHSVVISEKEKKRFCKKKKIPSDNYNINTSVRLVVKGDVAAEASVLASSRKYDFCVLDIGNVLQEKQALQLGSVGDVNIGNTIYALGFPAEAQNGGKLQYTADEVEIHSGEIQDTSALVNNRAYLQHSAVVTPNNSGGALVTKDGYLIGMNNAALINKDTDAFYALPIGEIREILDNYGIFYNSRERNTVYQKLQETYAECEKLSVSKDYKADTTDALAAVLREVEPVLTEQHSDVESIIEAQEKLDTARKQLTEKTPKMKIAMIVLGILCFLLFARFVWLLVWQYQAIQKVSVNIAASPKTKRMPFPAYKVGEMKVSEQGQGFASASNGRVENENNSGSGMGVVPTSSYRLENVDVTGQELGYAPSDGYEANKAAYQGQVQDAPSEVTVSLLQGGNETVILRSYAASNDGSSTGGGAFRTRKNIARLLRERTRQLITIDKPEYTIGKSSEAADFAITNNPAISRKHALVRWKNDAYYLFDLNSANGTFVNGKKIDSTGIRLENRDKVVLADEAFEFKLE